jgi:hypothetical protein
MFISSCVQKIERRFDEVFEFFRIQTGHRGVQRRFFTDRILTRGVFEVDSLYINFDEGQAECNDHWTRHQSDQSEGLNPSQDSEKE